MSEASVPESWRTFRTLAQIFVAFGQGSGQLGVSDDAVRAAVTDYAELIEKSGDREAALPGVLGIARVMGQAAAEHALRGRRIVITAEDYRAARKLIHDYGDEPFFGRCPWP